MCCLRHERRRDREPDKETVQNQQDVWPLLVSPFRTCSRRGGEGAEPFKLSCKDVPLVDCVRHV